MSARDHAAAHSDLDAVLAVQGHCGSLINCPERVSHPMIFFLRGWTLDDLEIPGAVLFFAAKEQDTHLLRAFVARCRRSWAAVSLFAERLERKVEASLSSVGADPATTAR